MNFKCYIVTKKIYKISMPYIIIALTSDSIDSKIYSSFNVIINHTNNIKSFNYIYKHLLDLKCFQQIMKNTKLTACSNEKIQFQIIKHHVAAIRSN